MPSFSRALRALTIACATLTGCSSLQPGTYSQDQAATFAAAWMRQQGGHDPSAVRRLLDRLGQSELFQNDSGHPEVVGGDVAPPPVPVPRVALGFCREGLDSGVQGACCSPSALQAPDRDRDGLADQCEQALAERFAPVVYHSSAESNFPSNVDAFLARSRLAFYDDSCGPDLRVPLMDAPTQADLIGHLYDGGCGSKDVVRSDGTASRHKHRTFFLEDVPEADRGGSRDTRDWWTYVHAYPSVGGSLTIQYWLFYPYNDSFNDHGGDWEGMQLVLDPWLHPTIVRFPGHWGHLKDMPATRMQWEGSHPRIFAESGGHAMHDSGDDIVARGCRTHEPCVIRIANKATHVRHETWPGGHVEWPDGRTTEAGRLLNLGSKRAPLNGQVFLRYTGLWGSPGMLFMTSGYWGPALNESRKAADGFRSAWCMGMTGPNLREECYPAGVTR